MCLGRAPDHAPDTYRFLNLATKKTVASRDAIWLNKVYGECKGIVPIHPSREMTGMVPTKDSLVEFELEDVQDPKGNSKKNAVANNRNGNQAQQDANEGATQQEGRIRMRRVAREDGQPLLTFPANRSTVPSPTRVAPAPTPQRIDRGGPAARGSMVEDVSTVGTPEVQRMLQQLAQVRTPAANSIADRVRDLASNLTDGTPNHQSGRGETGPSEQASLTVDAFAMIDRFGGDFDEATLPELAMFVDSDLQQQPKEAKYEKMDPTHYKDIFDKPRSFDEAWNHEEPFQRRKWREAINKELDKMNLRKAWRKIKRSQKPKDRRCVKHKWVLEIKRSGIFRA